MDLSLLLSLEFNLRFQCYYSTLPLSDGTRPFRMNSLEFVHVQHMWIKHKITNQLVGRTRP